MARYELGAVYRINADNGVVYYVRLLEEDSYGVFAPFEGELCEETLSKTSYRLYFTCNSFAVKRGEWEKVLPSPDSKDTNRWQSPDMANYANFNPELSLEQSIVTSKGLRYKCEKDLFINLVKSGMIKIIYNRHENIPSFLMEYYEGWPSSYVLAKVHLQSGTTEYQKLKREVLNEMGFDTTDL